MRAHAAVNGLTPRTFADQAVTARERASAVDRQRGRRHRDWEADERPFAEALKAWARTRVGRDAAAADLRVGRKTFDGWCDGRGAAQEAMARRLTNLTDRVHA